MTDPRYLAVKLLSKTFSSGSYSNIQLNFGLNDSDLSERDKKLCSAVYYGVIERKITLDHIISGLSSRPLNKLDDIVLNILRCGIYQIMYMDNIPDNAAVNESVTLAKTFKKSSASGMVNAVLRNFIRQGKKIALPKNSAEAMSIEYSAPLWLVKKLSEEYSPELAENLLSDSLGRPPVTVRVNTTLTSDDEFSALWKDCGVTVSDVLPHCFHFSETDPVHSDAFVKGLFHVQDLASQLCCMAISPTENDTVLDICAAPGGKTFTMAEMMGGKGTIMAFDLHEKRVKLIRDGAERLKLSNITANTGDASVFNDELPKFTKILCDVPCSGLGAIRRKPEIKYKNPVEFENLPDIQYKIAQNALNYLADGGEMVYSTCTLSKAENDDVVQKLLDNNPCLEPVTLPSPLGDRFGCKAGIFPCHFGSDGFFIAKFKKTVFRQ